MAPKTVVDKYMLRAWKVDRKKGTTYQGIADKWGVSITTVYNHLNENGASGDGR